MVAAASRVAGSGVEEGEEDLGHLFEVFVAEAGEEEGSGLGFGELGDGGAEGPGAGGVVGYVEEEGAVFFEGQKLEAAGPFGVADACFYCLIGYFVTILVTCLVILSRFVTFWLRNSIAAAIAKAMLRCWCWPGRGESISRGWLSRVRV